MKKFAAVAILTLVCLCCIAAAQTCTGKTDCYACKDAGGTCKFCADGTVGACAEEKCDGVKKDGFTFAEITEAATDDKCKNAKYGALLDKDTKETCGDDNTWCFKETNGICISGKVTCSEAGLVADKKPTEAPSSTENSSTENSSTENSSTENSSTENSATENSETEKSEATDGAVTSGVSALALAALVAAVSA